MTEEGGHGGGGRDCSGDSEEPPGSLKLFSLQMIAPPSLPVSERGFI